MSLDEYTLLVREKPTVTTHELSYYIFPVGPHLRTWERLMATSSHFIAMRVSDEGFCPVMQNESE